MREGLSDFSFSHWLSYLADFLCLFSYWLVYFLEFSHIFSKGREASSAYLKVCLLLSVVLTKATRASKWTFQKSGEAFSHSLKPQMKFKNYMSELLKNFKN